MDLPFDSPVMHETGVANRSPGDQHRDTTDLVVLAANLLSGINPDEGRQVLLVGFGSAVRLQNPLQAHTCKPTDNRDQQFTLSSLNGQLYMEEYNLCVQPETLTRGSEIYLRECSDIPEQSFDHLADGALRLTGDGANSFCVAVAPGAGEIINPIHKRRDLILTACEGTESSLIRWSFSPELSPQES